MATVQPINPTPHLRRAVKTLVRRVANLSDIPVSDRADDTLTHLADRRALLTRQSLTARTAALHFWTMATRGAGTESLGAAANPLLAAAAWTALAHINQAAAQAVRDKEGQIARKALLDVAKGDMSGAIGRGEVLSYQNLAENYPYIRDLLAESLTGWDTSGVLAERQRLVKLGYELKKSGQDDTSRINTRERDAMRAGLVDRFYGTGAVCQDRQAYVLVGLPGAGKSTLSRQIVSETGSLSVEGDDIRNHIPEFQKNHSQYQVDLEKAAIMEGIQARAFERGDNLLLGYVPARVGELRERLGRLKAQGYAVHLVHLDTTVDVAVGRSLKRLERTGRLSDPFAEKTLGNIPRADVEDVRHDAALVDSFTRIDNNGPLPRLLESQRHIGGLELDTHEGIPRGGAGPGHPLLQSPLVTAVQTIRQRGSTIPPSQDPP